MPADYTGHSACGLGFPPFTFCHSQIFLIYVSLLGAWKSFQNIPEPNLLNLENRELTCHLHKMTIVMDFQIIFHFRGKGGRCVRKKFSLSI